MVMDDIVHLCSLVRMEEEAGPSPGWQSGGVPPGRGAKSPYPVAPVKWSWQFRLPPSSRDKTLHTSQLHRGTSGINDIQPDYGSKIDQPTVETQT